MRFSASSPFALAALAIVAALSSTCGRSATTPTAAPAASTVVPSPSPGPVVTKPWTLLSSDSLHGLLGALYARRQGDTLEFHLDTLASWRAGNVLIEGSYFRILLDTDRNRRTGLDPNHWFARDFTRDLDLGADFDVNIFTGTPVAAVERWDGRWTPVSTTTRLEMNAGQRWLEVSLPLEVIGHPSSCNVGVETLIGSGGEPDQMPAAGHATFMIDE